MLIRILFSLLLISCIFDPADLILGLKVPLFVLLVGYSILKGNFSFNNRKLFNYVLLFSIILPVLSILIGMTTNSANYDYPNIFAAIKPYLFLFISFTFVNNYKLQQDIVKILSYELFLLAVVSLVVFTLNMMNIIPFELLYEFGKDYTLFAIGERTFGPFVINRIYFHTAPMLVFALCYFLNIYFKEKKIVFLLVSIIISASLFISGARNDMIMGILPYFALAYIYGSKVARMRIVVIAFIFVVYLMSQEFIMALFDKTEESNDTKIGFINNYKDSFSSLRTLILGDGLDSYFTVKGRGRVNITELTYFELLRRFGIFGTLIYLYLMFKPVFGLLRENRYQWLGLSYAMYLFMVFFNPFFFSSNGMVILSIVIVILYSVNKRKKNEIKQTLVYG